MSQLVRAEPATAGALWLTLDSPRHKNAFGWEMLEELEAKLDELEADRSTRLVLIRSAVEKVFVAGGDIRVMGDAGLADGAAYVQAGHHFLNRLEDSRIVFIAVVDGVALGGGTELALACDLVLASEQARFGLPETTLGLIPGWGGTQRMIRAVGQSKAKELIYTGRLIEAAEARDLRLANQVFPPEELEAEALKLAEAILANSPSAVADAKVVTTQGQRLAMEPGMALEVQTWLKNFHSPNRREGLRAFVERRKPQFEVEE